jgi:hypothetical protein
MNTFPKVRFRAGFGELGRERRRQDHQDRDDDQQVFN